MACCRQGGQVVPRRHIVSVAVLGCAVAIASCTSTTPAPPIPLPTSVLSPAPRLTGTLHRCPFYPPRANEVLPTTLLSVMQDHVPRWLPGGMGIVEAFGPNGPSNGGAFLADANCREIELWFW